MNIRAEVAKARSEAHREARSSHAWVRGRGTYLCTADSGAQCDPAPEASCPDWSGKVREVRELVERVLRDYPQVEKVYISGGFDGADTFDDLYKFDNYEPWTSTWEVTLWTRKDGWVK
jgi:hypothetical protein